MLARRRPRYVGVLLEEIQLRNKMHTWQGYCPFITLHLEGTRVHCSPCCRFVDGLEGLYHLQGYYFTTHNTSKYQQHATWNIS